ncbi:MAG: hypothetical protein M1829_004900 [Trizodia sp. TS-e1964]|nr:MAG: hypothetical protein M1829_004900 [Trizodia sp. TS-e1964]
MLSNPLHHHQYSPSYSHMHSPSSMGYGSRLPHHLPPHTDLDSFAHSQYGVQQLQYHQSAVSPSLPSSRSTLKNRHHPYDHHGSPTLMSVGKSRASPETKNSSVGPVRRRISRACDQCNQLRTKCDGQTPCKHCVEFNLTCEYIRERKKRGKASRKDIQQQQAAAAAAAEAAARASTHEGVIPTSLVTGHPQSPGAFSAGTSPTSESAHGSSAAPVMVPAPELTPPPSTNPQVASLKTNLSSPIRANSGSGLISPTGSVTSPSHAFNGSVHRHSIMSHHSTDGNPNDCTSPLTSRPPAVGEGLGITGFQTLPDYERPSMGGYNSSHIIHSGPPSAGFPPGHPAYPDTPYSAYSPQSHHSHHSGTSGTYRLSNAGESPEPGYLPATSTGPWDPELVLSSPWINDGIHVDDHTSILQKGEDTYVGFRL